jgi:hypothetical protein
MSDKEEDFDTGEGFEDLSDGALDDVDEEFYDEAGFSEDEEFIEEDWEAYDDEFVDEVPEKAAKKKGGFNKVILIGVVVAGGGVMMMMGGGDEAPPAQQAAVQNNQMTSTVVKREPTKEEAFIPHANDVKMMPVKTQPEKKAEKLGGILNNPDLLSNMEQEVDERYYDTDFYYDDEAVEDVVYEEQQTGEKPPMPTPMAQDDDLAFIEESSFDSPVMPMPTSDQDDGFDPPMLDMDEIIDIQISEAKNNTSIDEEDFMELDTDISLSNNNVSNEEDFMELDTDISLSNNNVSNEDSLSFPDVEDFMMSDAQDSNIASNDDVLEQEINISQEVVTDENLDLIDESFGNLEDEFVKEFEEVVEEPEIPEIAINDVIDISEDLAEQKVVEIKTTESMSTEVSDKLDKILSRIDSVEISVNEMRDQVAYQSDIPDVKSLQKSISALEKRIDKLAKEQRSNVNSNQNFEEAVNVPVKTQEKEVKTIPYQEDDEISTNADADIVKTLSVNTDWVLKSAKPGMAWVSKEGDNNLKSVSIGDRLEGVGKIKRIDILQGKWVVEGSNSKIVQ